MKLHPLIERYVAYRQSLGESFKTNAIILRAFARGSVIAPTSPLSAPAVSGYSWMESGRSPVPGTSGIMPCSVFTATPSVVISSRLHLSPPCCHTGHRRSSPTFTRTTNCADSLAQLTPTSASAAAWSPSRCARSCCCFTALACASTKRSRWTARTWTWRNCCSRSGRPSSIRPDWFLSDKTLAQSDQVLCPPVGNS